MSFEVWITGLREGQLFYECRYTSVNKEMAYDVAIEQSRFQRILLVEVKHNQEVVWTLRGGSGGRFTYKEEEEEEEECQLAVEAVAEAWASIDGKLEGFHYGKTCPKSDRAIRGDYYSGYMHEAEELLKRVRDRGYVLIGPIGINDEKAS